MPCGVSAGSRRAPAAGGPPAGRARSAAEGGGVGVLRDQVAQRVEPGLADRGEGGVRRRHASPAGRRRRPRPGRPGGSRRSPAPRARSCPQTATRAAAPSSERRGPPGSTVTTPWWISYAVRPAAPQRRAHAGGRASSRAPKRRATGSSPSPATAPAPRLHVVGDRARRASGSRRRRRAPAAGPRPAPRSASARPRDAQPGQVGDGRPGAGQHHEVGVGELLRGGGEAHEHARLGGQRVDVGDSWTAAAAGPPRPAARPRPTRRPAGARPRSRPRRVLGVELAGRRATAGRRASGGR